MRWLLFAISLAVVSPVHPSAARGECPGDLNGNGVVTVNEVVASVDALLNGCLADPCPGDLNGDHRVTVDEVVTAVSALLGGCDLVPTVTPTATPTVGATPTVSPSPASCPYTFRDDTLSLGISCGFSGPFSSNASCSTELSALVLSDGQLVAASVGSDPIITFGGVASSATDAALLAYFIGTDLTPQPVSGTLRLTNDGRTLVITPAAVPTFNIGGPGCTFNRYTGTFTGTFRDPTQSARRRLGGPVGAVGR
jgi:hypothetical protein